MTALKKKVLVSVSVNDHKDKKRHAIVCGNYVDWLKTGLKGYEVWAVDPADRKKVKRAADAGEIAGAVFTGGVDVDPKMYGEERGPHTGNPNVPRDQFESMVFDLLAAKKVPVLGICRGMQFVNVKMGGKVKQHVEGHARAAKNKDSMHKLALKKDSRLSTLFKNPVLDVNSAHHQAVDAKGIGKGLRVAGTAKVEGSSEVVEALEGTEKNYVLLVQWHPERMKASPVSKRLLADFAEAMDAFTAPKPEKAAKSPKADKAKKPATAKKAAKK
jgi:putative glutamine amidotransferase